MSINQSTSYLVRTINQVVHHNNNYTHPLGGHRKTQQTKHSTEFANLTKKLLAKYWT